MRWWCVQQGHGISKKKIEVYKVKHKNWSIQSQTQKIEVHKVKHCILYNEINETLEMKTML